MIKKVKIFFAIYIPVFVLVGVLLRNSAWLRPVGYFFAGVTIFFLGWLVYQMKFKKK